MDIVNPDVNQVTETIKGEISSRGEMENIPAFEQVIFGNPDDIRAELASLKRELETLKKREIHYDRDLKTHHKAMTLVVIFIKRVIRKLGRFLIEPIVGEINNYHLHVIRALDHTLNILEKLSAEDTPCESEGKK